MERFLLTLGRIAVVAGAITAMGPLLSGEWSTGTYIAGIGLLLVAGFVANRWWAAGLPLTVAVAMIAFNALAYGTEDYGDMGWWGYAFYFALFAGVASLVLLLGVAVRRAVRAGRSKRVSAGASASGSA